MRCKSFLQLSKNVHAYLLFKIKLLKCWKIVDELLNLINLKAVSVRDSLPLFSDINMFESMISNPVTEEGTAHKIEVTFWNLFSLCLFILQRRPISSQHDLFMNH